mmetsp:Transcript_84982/g.245423  ORF Transcript_84982/g.245423 Transcript_84982/m.245423 type:complete len:277 (-) Transcript_84982:82-912(-)
MVARSMGGFWPRAIVCHRSFERRRLFVVLAQVAALMLPMISIQGCDFLESDLDDGSGRLASPRPPSVVLVSQFDSDDSSDITEETGEYTRERRGKYVRHPRWQAKLESIESPGAASKRSGSSSELDKPAELVSFERTQATPDEGKIVHELDQILRDKRRDATSVSTPSLRSEVDEDSSIGDFQAEDENAMNDPDEQVHILLKMGLPAGDPTRSLAHASFGAAQARIPFRSASKHDDAESHPSRKTLSSSPDTASTAQDSSVGSAVNMSDCEKGMAL